MPKMHCHSLIQTHINQKNQLEVNIQEMQIKTRQGNDLKMQYEILIRHAADVCTLMVFERGYCIYFSCALALALFFKCGN